MTELLDDILFLSATDQRRMLIEKRFTATDLTRAYLARIERVNEELNAYVEVDAAGALAQAEDADRRRFLGEDTPVLGLTFGVKDLIDVAGLHTTYGSKAFADNIATKDAPAIARIRQAGGVILGKVNTTEFALFTPNTIKGPSRNPWDLGRTAGGSSNGSATAESGGLCSIAIGTDTAGSIRTPSSFCGVFGVKPTHGRVPAAGIGELSKHMDTVGAMGRCAEDIALTLQVMSGYDSDDITSADVPVPDFCNAVQQDAIGLSVSAPDVWVTDVISGEIKAIWAKALEVLAGAGAKVNSATLPDVSDIMSVWRGLGAGDIWQWHRGPLATKGDLYSDQSRFVLQSAESCTAAEVAEAFEHRFALRKSMLDGMNGADVMILPVTPVPAFTEEEMQTNSIKAGDQIVELQYIPQFCMPFNVTGQPSLTVPVGMSSGGLPLALQIVGRPFGEEAVLRTGAVIERLLPFNTQPVRYR